MQIDLSRACPGLIALNRMQNDSAAAGMGIRLTAVGADFLCAEMPVDERTRQPFGLLHGGASMVLAETLGSIASVLAVGGDPVAGVEISGSHVRALRDGPVLGVCRPVRIGRRLHVWQISISGPDGRLCCEARLTVAVLGDNA